MQNEHETRRRDGTPHDIGWEGMVYFTFVYALAVLFMFVIFDFALWTFGVAVAMFGYLAFNFWQ